MINGIVVAKVEISLLCPSESWCYKNREQIVWAFQEYCPLQQILILFSNFHLLLVILFGFNVLKLVPLHWKLPLGQLVRVEAD